MTNVDESFHDGFLLKKVSSGLRHIHHSLE